MDLSVYFNNCNTIEELLKLIKWRRPDLFNSRLRKIHSSMSDSEVYETYWDIVYKIATFEIRVTPDDFQYIAIYARDVYDTLGDDLTKPKPDNIEMAIYHAGILIAMLSFDDLTWTTRVNNDFSWPAYTKNLFDIFCMNGHSSQISAQEMQDFMWDNPDVFGMNGYEFGHISIRSIIDTFTLGASEDMKRRLYVADRGPNFEEGFVAVCKEISRYFKNGAGYSLDGTSMREEIIEYFFTYYMNHVNLRAQESVLYRKYNEDFAWESSGVDGMINMMDHVTYAYSTFPKDAPRLTQELIDNYIDDLVNYVVTTSKTMNVDNFFFYIRDVLNLVLPRIDKFPDTRLYIDAALNKAQLPAPAPVPQTKEMPFIATEAIMMMPWYEEMHSFVMEARNNEDEDEEETEEDEEDISSGNDIQKDSKVKTKESKKYNEASTKIYSAFKKVEKSAGKLDSNLESITKSLKRCLVGDVTTAVIEGKKFSPIEVLVRLLGTGAIFRYNKIAGIIAIVVQYCAKKHVTASERKKILLDLERELEIIEEKIEDAKGDGNKQAKYALMRTRNDLKNAIQRIKYGLEADDRASATAQAVVKTNNPRRM